MENWKSELDTLIRDTMAFAAAAQMTVSASRPAVVQTVSLSEQPPIIPAAPVSLSHRETLPNTWMSSEREEISRHVASFKAHQERWIREREEYANSILKRIAR